MHSTPRALTTPLVSMGNSEEYVKHSKIFNNEANFNVLTNLAVTFNLSINIAFSS